MYTYVCVEEFWIEGKFLSRIKKKKNNFLKNSGTEQIAQWLRILVVYPEELGSIPRIHMAAHNYF